MSTIEKAERLKKELTDKWVVVAANAPELKRFANLTGKVKTINMSCRALVEFDGPVDIGWYDIDTSFLTVVDAPQPKKATAHAEKPAAKAAPAPAAAKPAATGGGSALDKIRAAGAKPAAAAPAAGGSPLDKIRAAGAKPAASAPAAGGSPLDKIRAAAKPAAPVAEAPAAEAPAAPAEAPAPTAPKAAAPMTGSPLDRIRAMGAAKKE